MVVCFFPFIFFFYIRDSNIPTKVYASYNQKQETRDVIIVGGSREYEEAAEEEHHHQWW